MHYYKYWVLVQI